MKSLDPFSESNLKDCWDQAAEKVAPYFDAPSTKIYLCQEKKIIDKYFVSMKGKKFLKTDLWNEAKNTQILSHVLGRRAEVYGIDISPRVTQQAINRTIYNPSLPSVMTADIRKLPFADETFDYVYSMGTVEHFPDSSRAIKEVYRVLKKGGTAIIGVPNKFDVFLRPVLVFIMQKLGLYSFGYEKSYSKKQLRAELERAKFRIQDFTSLLFMPGLLRILDLFFYVHIRLLTKFSKILLAPFVFLYNRFPFFSRKGYLIAYIVKK
jgi:SAM-dependent methyltransferase